MKKDIVTAEIIEKIKTEYGRNSFAMSPTQWIKRIYQRVDDIALEHMLALILYFLCFYIIICFQTCD